MLNIEKHIVKALYLFFYKGRRIALIQVIYSFELIAMIILGIILSLGIFEFGVSVVNFFKEESPHNFHALVTGILGAFEILFLAPSAIDYFVF